MPLESVVKRPAVWLQLVLQDVVGPAHPGVTRLPLPLLQVLPQALQHGAVGRVRRQVPRLQRVSSASRQMSTARADSESQRGKNIPMEKQ